MRKLEINRGHEIAPRSRSRDEQPVLLLSAAICWVDGHDNSGASTPYEFAIVIEDEFLGSRPLATF